MELRRIHDISLKWKLLIPFLFLSFVGTTSLILLGLGNQRRLIETQEEKKLFDYYRAFSDQIEDRKRSALSLAYEVAQSPAVQEAFANRNRQTLIELLQPTYQILEREFDIKQFHFHTRPATSFLRLHRLHQSGENMESYRHTINEVIKSGEGIAGLEWGLTGFGARGVAPVYHKNELIGTFEIGYSVEWPFLESLKHRYEMDLALLTPGAEGQGFTQLANTSGNMPVFSADLHSQVYGSQRTKVLISPSEALGSAVLLGPLKDFSGKSIGIVEISVDRANTLVQLAKNRNMMFAIMGVALAISSVLIWWITVIFLRPVHHIVGVAREIAAGRRVQKIEVPVHDEIGTLADSLNDMLEFLNRARQEIQLYCDTLEERVEARTSELIEEKEKFETLVENAPLIVYRIEPDGTNVFVNRLVEEILGYRPTEVIGDRDFWTKTVHPEDRKDVAAGLRACLVEGSEFHMEYRGINKKGMELFLLNHAIPLIDKEGEVQAVDGIIVDVTERKWLQEKILQTEELQTLTKISAQLAHEFRNPLTSAGGFARRLLQEMDEKDSRRKKVEIIVQEVSRLEHLLKMILSYIRPISLEFSEVDLNELLKEAITIAEDKLSNQAVRLELDLDDTIPSIQGDPSHLKHAMKTIIQNACDHMPQKACLRVTTTHNGAAVIRLRYKALHTANDEMEHFFSPFVTGELEDGNLEIPFTKLVIHKHGGIISINRGEQDQIVITITFAVRRA